MQHAVLTLNDLVVLVYALLTPRVPALRPVCPLFLFSVCPSMHMRACIFVSAFLVCPQPSACLFACVLFVLMHFLPVYVHLFYSRLGRSWCPADSVLQMQSMIRGWLVRQKRRRKQARAEVRTSHTKISIATFRPATSDHDRTSSSSYSALLTLRKTRLSK